MAAVAASVTGLPNICKLPSKKEREREKAATNRARAALINCSRENIVLAERERRDGDFYRAEAARPKESEGTNI